MILHVVDAKPLADYRLWLTFDDGVEGCVDLSGELWGTMFAPLKDPQLFASAVVDPICKTVTWSNGADFAPEYLKQLLTEQMTQCHAG
ncbi:MAG: DUF2442 domain-containing protein [Moraxellaceae bacterium]|nr:DUF2442 domain-containing protein [Moraxellaceae bacterium]